MPIGNTTLPNLAQRNRLVGISSAGLIISGSVIISGSANTITLSGASTTQTPATQTFVTTQVSNLVDAAPAALDTLNELAAAIGDDANFATTISTALGNRLRVDTASQGLTSTQQGYARTNLGLGTAATTAATAYATAAQGANADTAYGWGNHASAGYLTSFSETDTLASVTGRGASTSTAVTLSSGGNTFNGHHYFSPYDSNGNHYPHYNSGANNNGSKLNLRMFDNSGNVVLFYLNGSDKSIQWNGNTIWHAGNDGANSGLDADLLDGQHGTYYYAASNPNGYTTNTGTVTSVGGTGTVAGLTLTGTVTTSGNLTLGGTLSTPVSTINDSTTVGRNLVKLTNPSAIRFIRINGDNTVDALDASTFRTAIGAGTSSTSGTVTSVGGTGTVNGISLSGTVTTSGNLTLGGTLSGIGNSQLTNSSITIAGTSTALGSSISQATILAGSGVFSGSAQVNGASITNNTITVGSTSITLGSSATTISGLTSVNSTNFAASNAFYLNGTSTFLNYTNGRVYSNSGYETAVNVVAPIYYDANNTGYYVDPASTSNIVNISADRYYQKGNGIPSNNLGDPTVTEMALFDSQFNNKTAFYNPALLKFYTSTNGSTWTEYTSFSTGDKKAFVGGDGTSGVNIPYNTPYFAIEVSATGYVFLNALYMYWSSNGHSSTVKTQIRRVDNATWYDHTTSNASVSSWPGHLYLPFNGVPFLEGPSSSTGHYDKIRFIFQPSWNGSFSSNPINLYTFQVWGGYPAGKRNVYYTDSDANVTFPGDLRATTFYDSNDTAYYLDSTSTSDAALRIRGGALHGPNATWGKYLMVGGDGRQNYTNNADVASVSVTDGNLHIDAASNKSLYLNYYDGASIEIGSGGSSVVASINTDGSFRPQLIYDYNNTNYYVDPASTSYINVLQLANKIIVGSFPNSTTNTGEAWLGRASDRSAGNMTIQLGTGTGRKFEVVDYGWTTVEFSADDSGVATAAGSFRAPAFYDSGDTTYYLDPAASTSVNIAGQITTARTSGTLISSAGADTIGVNTTTGLGAYIKGTSNTYIYGGGKFYDGSATRTLWHSGDFSSTNVSNWNTAYGWGNHASAGYLTSFSETDTLASVTGRGASTSTLSTFTGGISVDGLSYVTANGYFRSGNNGFRWNDSSGNYNNVIMRDNGTTWFRNYLETSDSMRAGIFYDYSNTAYYVDPASTSNLVGLTVANTISGNISGNAATATSVSGLTINNSGASINPDNVTQNQIGYNTNVSLFGQTDGGLYSSAYSSSWIHQIYGDFRTGQIAIRGKNNGTWQSWRSVLDSTNFSTWAATAAQGTKADTAYGWGNHASAGYISTSYLDDYTRGTYRVISDYGSNTTWYIRDNGQFIWGRAHDWTQSFRLSLLSGAANNSTWAYLGQQDSNTTNGTWRGISIRKYASGGTAAGDLQANGVYAQILYDDNDTNYYVNPAGTSNLADLYATEIYANNWFRNVGSNEGLYNQSTTQHWSSNTNGLWDASSTTNATTGATGIRLYAGGHVNTLRGYLYSDGDGFGLLNNQGGWSVRANQGTGYGGQLYGSWQAPILYDSNDTNYYVDPASTSRLNNIRTWGVSAIAGDGIGYGFWDGYGGSSYSIWMSSTSNGTYGGQVSGVGSNNDYNMYFKMAYNNRGFVFITGDSTPKVQIANEGLHVAGNIYTSTLYDRDDTGYYVDPAGVSVIGALVNGTNNSFILRDYFCAGGDYNYENNIEYAQKGGVTSNTSYPNIQNEWAGELYFNGTVLNECVAGQDIDKGHLVYLRNNGKWMKADAIGASTSTLLLGIALKTATTDGTLSILLNGIINVEHHAQNYTATPGLPLYVATSNIDAPGYVTQDAPTSTGEVVRLIGHNIIDNASGRVTIKFNPDNTWIEL